jgi:hypothetical protein
MDFTTARNFLLTQRVAQNMSTGKRISATRLRRRHADPPAHSGSDVEAVEPLGDAARFVAAVALDHEVDDNLQVAVADGFN